MAADVDKSTPERERSTGGSGQRSPGCGAWFRGWMWTLLAVCAVPLAGFGIKYYQNSQLLRRHVRSTSGIYISVAFKDMIWLIIVTFNDLGLIIKTWFLLFLLQLLAVFLTSVAPTSYVAPLWFYWVGRSVCLSICQLLKHH